MRAHDNRLVFNIILRESPQQGGEEGCASLPGRAKTRHHSAREDRRGAWRRAAQEPKIRYRDRSGCGDAADCRGRKGKARHPRRSGLALRQVQGQDLARLCPRAVRPAERQAGPRDRDHPDPGRRGQDDDHRRARRRVEPHRQKGDPMPARAQPRAVPGRADGGHQPPFHRRFSRNRRRQQFARRNDRQPHLLGQRARYRPAPRHLAPGDRHERPGLALDRLLTRRGCQRLPGISAAVCPISSSARPETASRCAPSTSRPPDRWLLC